MALAKDLEAWHFTEATLLQYVDDLLLACPTKEICDQATKSLLNFLAQRGYKVSKEKAQLSEPKVTYLGITPEGNTRTLGEGCIQPIIDFPLPQTPCQLRGFLGDTSYCRIWIPG